MSDSPSQVLEVKAAKVDYSSDQEVRWCPGCGDYAVLAGVKKALAELQIPRENAVFISGIGCSSRFPYYLNTFGFHTIHGRAPTVATGLRLVRPDLHIWVVTGDGDGLSIGASHLMHLMRRNIKLNVLLFNNQIYGLTKGQASPTSEKGKKTKSSPQGTLEEPLQPALVAMSANASFVARVIDVDAPRLHEILLHAARHEGTAFIEIYQNCNVFNDGAFASFAERVIREEKTIQCRHNQPLLFGVDKQKGLSVTESGVNIIELDGTDASLEQVTRFDETDKGLVTRLLNLDPTYYPVALGILHRQLRPLFEAGMSARVEPTKTVLLDEILAGDQSWVVSKT